MGWERRRGRLYYYGKERTADGRVRSIYFGGGALGQSCADVMEDAQWEADWRRKKLRAELEPVDALLDALRASEARLREFRDAYLLATGHHSHRGQWRHRRGVRLAPFLLTPLDHDRPPRAETMPRKKTPAKTPPEPIGVGAAYSLGGAPIFKVPDVPEDLRRRLASAMEAAAKHNPKKAGQNNPEALERLRAVLTEFPAEAFGPFLGPLSVSALANQLTSSPNGLAFATAEAERFAASLKEPGDGLLVLAACDQVAAARLALDIVTTRYGNALSGDHSLTLAQHYEKRMNAAQTRYLRALATAAKLREVEGMERRRAERHAASRPAPPRDTRRPIYAALPPHSGDGHADAEAVELTVG